MMTRGNRPEFVAGVLVALSLTSPARAIDEIQVYNAEIAEIRQWTIQQHLNYAIRGRKEPDFPGGLVPNHTLNGTPELAYGITDWWELGFYAPFAVSDHQFLSNGAKIRTLFVSPDAGKRNFFYGVNIEFSYQTSRFAETRHAFEIRPIIGVRNKEWEFIVNPIVDIGLGSLGEADFAPAARLARNLGNERFIGLEYYSDLGKIGNFLPLSEQSHQLFVVSDFKLGELDFNVGIGYGLTPGSDRLVTKAIIGYAFPVPGAGKETNSGGLKPLPSARSAAWSSRPPVPEAIAAMR